MKPQPHVLALIFLSALLFSLSLYLPAATFDRTCPTASGESPAQAPVAGIGGTPIGKTSSNPGLFYLVFGGLALYMGSLGAIGWAANPLAILGVMATWQRKDGLAIFTTSLSLLLAATSLHATNRFVLLGDEGGVCRSSAIAPNMGYWFWLTSIALLFIAAFANCKAPRPNDA